MKGGPYGAQQVMAVINAKECYDVCPHCKSDISDIGLILMLEQFHIYPALCCNNMVWVRNGGSKKFLKDMV